MKIIYCKKYEKYVSKHHCEFFNEGENCPYYNPTTWASIKELLQDVTRPKWEIGEVVKPLKCSLLNREALYGRGRGRSRIQSASGR
ncbi:MAG: hypothetical protein ACLFVT_00085 [Syntrophobacteria bacterium]